MQGSAVKQNSWKQNKGNNLLFPLFVSLAGGAVGVLLWMVIGSMVLSHMNIPLVLPVFSFIALAFGAVVTGLLTARAFRCDKLIMCAISGLMLALILVLCNLICFREAMSTLSWIKYGTVILVSVGMSFCVPTNKKRRIRR